MINIKYKVLAYFVRKNGNQKEILVFDHQDMPEAGTQIIGGTVEPNEDLIKALIREIKEESGLIIREEQIKYLGETTYQRKDRLEINKRTYFKIEALDLPDSWSHVVISDGEDNGLIFNYYWIDCFNAAQKLTGNFAECLHLI